MTKKVSAIIVSPTKSILKQVSMYAHAKQLRSDSIFFPVSITHVQDQAFCEGGGPEQSEYVDLKACARVCAQRWEMIAFGTNKYGGKGCNAAGRCKCFCQTNTNNYRCTQVEGDSALILYAVKFARSGASYSKT